jgi:hypothetical protein
MLPLQNEIFDLILVEKYVYELFRLRTTDRKYVKERLQYSDYCYMTGKTA